MEASRRRRRNLMALGPPRDWVLAMKRPFLSDEPNVGPPPHSLDDLKCPRLRKSPLQPDAFEWRRRLGGGLDGYTWKIRIDGEPFALKVFYDTEPPEIVHYHAIQRECQNAAVLQVMEAVLADSSPVQSVSHQGSKHFLPTRLP
ncbi:hypothetical protein XA68_10454 [Ophiocordyceps unilateralis]|uniref:Protein kinase domain-containing protein n=1 Tax=Ophiocordyceps unilateralis TaxID=268505 RepID=A0A2A9PIU7_OPHUN|nr:hypothetical protein XA68_10454 [Ophiocordyceps unilateralis]